MIRVILENIGGGFFTINGVQYVKSEVMFFPCWPDSEKINIQQYHAELLYGLVHYSEVKLADGTLFGSTEEILEWADTNAFGGGGGGSKVFDSSGDFPNPGKEGILYIDSSDDSMWYWDGTQYVQFASVKQFANFSGFPATGNPGFLYIDRAGLASYYWNGSTYIQLSGPGTFIRNQNVLAQAGNFWINGTGGLKQLLLDPANTGMNISTDGLQLILDFWTASRGISFRAGGAEAASMFRDAAGQSSMLTFPGEFRLARANPVGTGGNNWGTLNLYGGANPAGWQQIRLAGYNVTLAQEQRWSLAHKIVLYHPNTGGAGDQDTVPGVGIGSSDTRMHFSVPNASGGFMFFAGLNVLPFWIGGDGQIIAGTQAGNGARLQVQGGVLSLAAATSDFAVINGGMWYRSDTQKFRGGINGIPTNFLTESSSGSVLIVDNQHPEATDNRTGISKTSVTRPWATINAAVQAAGGMIVCVMPGTYAENIASSGASIRLVMYPNAVISGNIAVYGNGDLSIFGMSEVVVDSSRTVGTAQIYTNQPAGILGPFGMEVGGIHTDVGNVYLRNVIATNSNTACCVSARNNFSFIGSRIIANGPCGTYQQGFDAQIITDSFLLSRNSYAVPLNGSIQICRRTTAISLSAAGYTDAFITGGLPQIVEDCKIYSQNGRGFYGDAEVGRSAVKPFMIKGCQFNTFKEAFRFIGDGNGEGSEVVDQVYIITGNTINVRDAATVNAFLLHQRAVAHTNAPIVMDNRYNKASFDVAVPDGNYGAPLANVVANNVGSLAFPAQYPWIFNPADI